MIVGSLRLDLLLGEVSSLKQKRAVVRPVVAALRRFDVSAAETAHHDLLRRAEIGVSLVGADAAHVRQVLDRCEREIASRPEVDLLSAHAVLWDDEDE
ncbi:MAG: DUF503 domain-containing protein [Actinomycetales bacterium]